MAIATTSEAARRVADRRADTTSPLERPQTAPAAPDPAPADRPPSRAITISTTVQRRGRSFTITASGYTIDQFCDLLDAAGYAAPAAEWRTLPDGRPICGKHDVPMKLRSQQGDEWWSHNVGTKEDPIYCKGYRGPDSPGYDH